MLGFDPSACPVSEFGNVEMVGQDTTYRVLGDRGYPWFLWVLGPCGLFVILPHYLRIFVFEGKSQNRAIEQEAEKIRKEQS